jgi:NAD(P)-dependent dehydrogenase (short-subunit alcohol dehydrogenase family)
MQDEAAKPLAVVVGGSSGIGKATAARFASEGWRVLVAANDLKKTEEAAANLDGHGHLCFGLDISREEDCRRLAGFVDSHALKIQALINSAGVSLPRCVLAPEFAEWNRPLDVMLHGAVHLCRHLVPHMNDGGRIIHVTSIHHERVMEGSSAYGMAKAALTQYTRSLALELAPRGILANAIAPGFVNTPMSVKQDGINELETEWFRDNYIRYDHLPLRRAGRPEEIAGVAWFLAGSDASYITGSVVTVDGGLTITF